MSRVRLGGSVQVWENEVGKTTVSVSDVQKTVLFGRSKGGNKEQTCLPEMRSDDAFLYEERRRFEVQVFKLPGMQDIFEASN